MALPQAKISKTFSLTLRNLHKNLTRLQPFRTPRASLPAGRQACLDLKGFSAKLFQICQSERAFSAGAGLPDFVIQADNLKDVIRLNINVL